MREKLKRIISVIVLLIVIINVVLSTRSVSASNVIKLNKTSFSIAKGSSYTLKLLNCKSKVKWCSSNKDIATVNSNGKVKGIKTGKVNIIAKVGKYKYICKVTVIKSLSDKDLFFEYGGKKIDFYKESKNYSGYIWRIGTSDSTKNISAPRNIKLNDTISKVSKVMGVADTHYNKEGYGDIVCGEKECFYYMEYSYTEKKDTYHVRFFFDKNKKLQVFAVTKNFVSDDDFYCILYGISFETVE